MILMIATTLGLSLILGLASTGGGGHGHRASAPSICQACGVDGRATLPLIAQLQLAPRWQARDNAAHALRKFDWRRHPEVVYALCDALLLDPKDDVREEAAEALKEMKACVPVAHEALRQAAVRDPKDDVREEAREALKSMKRRCLADCRVCGPLPTNVMIQGPNVIPENWLPMIAPAPGPVVVPSPVPGPDIFVTPPGELPPALEPILEGPVDSRPL
jgi:hypothetical protein